MGLRNMNEGIVHAECGNECYAHAPVPSGLQDRDNSLLLLVAQPEVVGSVPGDAAKQSFTALSALLGPLCS